MKKIRDMRGTGAQLIRESFSIYLTLLKILVPTLIIVKVLEMLGATAFLATLLGPVMALIGLPESAGLVWATTLLTNIYTGMVVFLSLAEQQSMTVAQVSVLGTLMLIAHALPFEGAVAKKAGVPWWFTLLLRIGGALILGALVHLCYQHFGWLQQPNQLAWQAPETDGSLFAWAKDQLLTIGAIFFIIFALVSLLWLLRKLGVEKLLHWALFPLLRLLGIGRDAANITIIGITMGLSFGAGILLNEVGKGKLNKRDVLLTVSFLGLCHSLIEDTLLVMLLGAHLSAILWARLAFSVITIAIMARLLPKA
ncbi:hypothetical protein [Lacimicrobium alkaliphilum]|uniref:Nucleoside recognition protein n=1 Tax=Lacimicrobium alkaliphilum TaxID=1526571 RepID=A0ABQ1RHC5_9ALTE|nr:hypothetical protein [Lacimicrobium alkaliphilum]GGD70380.1 hypothetical protein GCM10011357_26850 [Lacimicrobium alkaliphilum]